MKPQAIQMSATDAMATNTDAAAQAVYQDLLDRIGEAYLSNDFESFSRMIRVPHQLDSFKSAIILKTETDLKKLFVDIQEHYTNQGIDHIARSCLAATFITPNEILGMHETRLIAKNQVTEAPYPVKSVLKRIDGTWWVCSSDNALELGEGFGNVLANYTQKGAKTVALQHTHPGKNPDTSSEEPNI